MQSGLVGSRFVVGRRVAVLLGGVLLCLAGTGASLGASPPVPGAGATSSGGHIAQTLAPFAPGPCALQVAPLTVTVCWTDRSTTETRFVVSKRDAQGNWGAAYQVTSSDTTGTGETYRWVDTDTSVSGQCYTIAAVGSAGAGETQEECTVRPNQGAFPLSVPVSDKQWYGLSEINDGTGDLHNGPRGRSVVYAHEFFGVDLAYSSNTALWKIQAQGGPHLMYGEAVALRVWGGGWLAYGHQDQGTDLVLSSTPAYQWYVVGETPGNPIDNAEFALWNSTATRYLTGGYEPFGISLNWVSEPGPTVIGTYQTSITLPAQTPGFSYQPGYVVFSGFFGGGASTASQLMLVSNPANGPTLYFLTPGHPSSECGSPNSELTLPPAATLSGTSMIRLYGYAMPSLAQPLKLLICAKAPASSVTLNLQYQE